MLYAIHDIRLAQRCLTRVMKHEEGHVLANTALYSANERCCRFPDKSQQVWRAEIRLDSTISGLPATHLTFLMPLYDSQAGSVEEETVDGTGIQL